MSYIHVPTGRYPLSAKHIRAENPNVSFPAIFVPPPEYATVVSADRPAYDPIVQEVREIAPVLTTEGVWQQRWEVVALPDEQIAHNQAQQAAQRKAARQQAYIQESDPLFFKAQRGEATMDDWRAKVDEIKSRYPA